MAQPPAIEAFTATAGKLSDDVGLVAVTGELDLYAAPRLEAAIQSASDTDGAVVVVDLSGTSFIDSTALGVLLAHVRRLAARGGRLVLVSNDPRTVRLLEVTGVDRRLPLRSTVKEALDELAEHGGEAA
jgi:anti-sigma B factor antagonist